MLSRLSPFSPLRGSIPSAHTMLAVSDATGISPGHLWYDPHGSVLTSTLPVTPALSGVEGLVEAWAM